jgi:hypothetical protein
MESTALVVQAINLCQEKIRKLRRELENPDLLAGPRAKAESQMKVQQEALLMWTAKYKKMAGAAEAHFFEPDELHAGKLSPHEIAAGAAEIEVLRKKRHFEEKINGIRNGSTILQGHCWEVLQASEKEGEYGFSAFGLMKEFGSGAAHLLGGQPIGKPADIANRSKTAVDHNLSEAERLYAKGMYDEAEAQLKIAANRLMDDSIQFDGYQFDVTKGGKRSEATAKVAAAVAITLASGGTAAPLTIGQGMLISGEGEGIMQGALLILQKLDGKSQVTNDDMVDALVATAIATGAGGLGRTAGKGSQDALRIASDTAAKGLTPKLVQLIQLKLGRNLTEKEITWVAAAIRRYVESNSSELMKLARAWQTGEEHNLNLLYMTIAPLYPPGMFKAMKENEFNEMVTQ